jgi:hypothetical protein
LSHGGKTGGSNKRFDIRLRAAVTARVFPDCLVVDVGNLGNPISAAAFGDVLGDLGLNVFLRLVGPATYLAIGNFADPNFPAPTIAVWEESRHSWVSLPPDAPPKRVAKQGW